MKITEQNMQSLTEQPIVYEFFQQGARLIATGGGDMTKAVYDPNTVEGDAFAMDNMAEGADTKILTAAERSAIAINSNKVSRDTPVTVTDLGTLGATLIMDMSGKGKAEFEAATSATALTISITNPPASGLEGEATIMLDTTTLPASITFPSGSVDAPTITEGKIWELSFKTIDGGPPWRVIGKEWSA